jgi:hypothetical protein
MAEFDLNDDSVVVVLEAGALQSQASFINDDWKSFSQRGRGSHRPRSTWSRRGSPRRRGRPGSGSTRAKPCTWPPCAAAWWCCAHSRCRVRLFEHHAAMTPVSAQAFLHEYRIAFAFAVGVAAPSADARQPIPVTMQAHGRQGPPSLPLIDHNGHPRRHAFGAVDDLALGAAIATRVAEGD